PVIAQRFRMIWIEAKHTLESSERIAFASEVDQDLSEGDERGEVVDVASDQCDDSRQRAARPSSPPIRPDELHDSRVVIWRGDQSSFQLSDCARVVTSFCEESPECDARLYLTLIDTEAGTVSRDTVAGIPQRSVETGN